MTKEAADLDADPEVRGIYVTLNAVNPALLARRANRVKMRLTRSDSTTSDADILRRRWLPLEGHQVGLFAPLVRTWRFAPTSCYWPLFSPQPQFLIHCRLCGKGSAVRMAPQHLSDICS